MKTEIISVGIELLLGQVINTGASYVARALSESGIDMMFSCTMGNNNDRLKEALTHALKRSDLVITTGGLGPAEDDLTKGTIAECADAPLVMHEESMKRLREHFNDRYMDQNQMKQTILPEGSTVLLSDRGTAPGCAVEAKEGKIIVMFPGPPSELIPMLHDYEIPFLMERENASIFSVNVHVFGQGEDAVAEVLSDMMDASNPAVTTYAKEGEMYVRVTAKAENAQEAGEMRQPVVERIRERIGDYVYDINIDSLGQLAVNLLSERKMTIATAESCSDGLLTKRITDIPGSSQMFEIGAATYANRIKTLLLNVPEKLLEEYGAVGEEAAAAIAEGMRKESGSDIGIDITGIAGPDGDIKEEPVGLTCAELSDKDGTVVRRVKVFSHRRPRNYYKYTAASFALDMVRRRLEGLPLRWI